MRYRISQIKIDPLKVAAQGGGIDRELLMGQLEKAIEKAVEKAIDKAVKKAAGRETCEPSETLEVKNISIVRESIDARKKPDVKLVYTADFDCDVKLPVGEKSHFSEAVVREYSPVWSGANKGGATGREGATGGCGAAGGCGTAQKHRPVVVGFGPCGMFAGLILAEAGLKPIILERGKSVDERVADVEKFWRECEGTGGIFPDPESNVQFGEGGAGTFSDGKLTTGIKDVRIRKVLQEFVEAGGPEEILYKHKPHIGTDKLRDVVKNIRHKIELLGGEVRFQSRLDGIEVEEGSLKGIRVVRTGAACTGVAGTDEETQQIETDTLILAIGHSARDTFRMLYDLGFDMKQKPFSIGVRIEHPQTMIDKAQYGNSELAKVLGPADYKLSYRCGEDETTDSNSDSAQSAGRNDAAGRGVYTFCMCPGGQVVNASTEPGTSVTNGMSNSARDGKYANSAVLVDVRTSDFAEVCDSTDMTSQKAAVSADHPLAGIEFQKKYEKLAWENRTDSGMTRATYGEFRNNESGRAVRNSIPAFASEAILEAVPYFGERLKGFDRDDAIMTAVESRSSSPVRVVRDENLEASVGGRPVRGIIPAGEGPGYAGGIMSASVDGIRAAEAVIIRLLEC